MQHHFSTSLLIFVAQFPKMAKTRAEIQKAYRQRQKKAKGEAFLAKERQRVKRYYRTTDQLSVTQLQCRRQAISERVMKHRRNVKSHAEKDRRLSTRSSTLSPVKIKLNYHSESMRKRKRKRDKAMAKAQRVISSLEKKVHDLEKSSRKLRKRCQ